MLLLNITNRNFSRQSVMEFATFAKLRTDRFSSEEGFALNSIPVGCHFHPGGHCGRSEGMGRKAP